MIAKYLSFATEVPYIIQCNGVRSRLLDLLLSVAQCNLRQKEINTEVGFDEEDVDDAGAGWNGAGEDSGSESN